MPGTKERRTFRAAGGLQADEIFTAAVSLASSQYFFVTAGSITGEVVIATGASNPAPLGVLQNTPAAAGKAIVRVFGRTSIAASPNACDLRFGRFVTAASNGAGLASVDNACTVLGRWLSASTAVAATGTAFVNCIVPGACAIAAAAS